MTNRAPRRAPLSNAQLPPGTVAVHRVYSIGIGQLEDGSVTVVVGKMDTTTKRYAFFVPARDDFQWELSVSLHDLLVIAAGHISDDPETQYL